MDTISVSGFLSKVSKSLPQDIDRDCDELSAKEKNEITGYLKTYFKEKYLSEERQVL